MNRIWFFVLLLLTSIGLFTSSAYAVALQSENSSGNKLAEQTTGLLAGGSGSIDLPSVDAEKIREAWLNWHNEERTSKWLEKLSYQSDLERTATDRSTSLVEKYTGHKRPGMNGYYNYNGIKKWFSERGVNFIDMSGARSLFSESIGYRYYKCSSGDCTETAIKSLRKIFDGYLKEGTGGVHYKAILMPHFTQMGVGVKVNPQNNMIYATLHYGANLQK